MRRAVVGLAAVVGVLSAVACGDTTSAPPALDGSLTGAITVSAAASLAEVVTAIRDELRADHPRVEVTLNLGSSGQLAGQIEGGAPVDVVALADTVPMDRLVAAGLVAGEPQVFAHNRLVVVTKPGNPEGVAGLSDLPSAGVVALCVETAPCGRYAAELLAEAGVTLPEAHVTRGQDVRATLAAVRGGDADAAIVYASDATTAGDAVEVIEVPEAEEIVASYPVAVIEGSAHPAVAEAFVARVLGEEGEAILARAGFLPA